MTHCAPKWNKTDNKNSHPLISHARLPSHHPGMRCLLPPAKHVVYPTMTANSLHTRLFHCNGKMWAVGIGYEIAMDAGSCWDRGTLQDSITDSAPRLCSPFIGNQRIFVNLCGNSYGHQSRGPSRRNSSHMATLEAYLGQTDAVCDVHIWNSCFHLCREPV